MQINHKVQLNVPADNVWQVIYALESYPQWNPFVEECESSLCVGDSIKMKVRLLPPFLLPQKETIKTHTPNEKLSYGISLPFSMLSSHREHKVVHLDNSTCVYLSSFSLSGWFAPVVDALLGASLHKGFAGMTKALAERAQGLSHQPQT